MKKQKNSFPVWLANVRSKGKSVYKLTEEQITIMVNTPRTDYANGLNSVEASKKYFERK